MGNFDLQRSRTQERRNTVLKKLGQKCGYAFSLSAATSRTAPNPNADAIRIIVMGHLLIDHARGAFRDCGFQS
jgi:hypothetical protein